MKKNFTALLLFSVLVAVIAGVVYAGVEPVPFRSQTNKLWAVVNVLESVDMRLEGVLYPPDDVGLPPDDVGITGRLEAMSTQLVVLNKRTDHVINTFPPDPCLPPDPCVPPDPILPVETIEALISVRNGASMVMERAQGGFEVPPDDIGVTEALMMVEMGAENIVMTVDAYLIPTLPLPD